jgi:hypothetical protein
MSTIGRLILAAVLFAGAGSVRAQGTAKASLAVEDLGAAAGAPLVLHVSPDGNDRWSGQPAEPNTSHTDGPLATPQRARDVLRERRREGASLAAAEVRLHGGRYRLSEPLVFTPEDSGPTTWTAAPGATPVLSGAVAIDGWRRETACGLQVWTADVSALQRAHGPVRSLFVNGERRSRPRLPTEGTWRIESVPGRSLDGNHWKTLFDGSDSFVSAPGTVAPWRNLADVEAVVLHFWIEERLPLTTFDPATRLVRTGRKTLMALVDEKGDAFPRYWVENVFEALAPGEWYLDRPSARLTYAPRPGERPETTRVEVPVLTSLLRLEGGPEKGLFVEGLRFEGIAFEHAAVPTAEPAVQAAWTTPGTLVLRGARRVTIEDGRIAGVGGYAVEIGPGCRDVRVVGNEMTDVGAGGVKVDGADASDDPRLRTTAVALTDNHVHAIGRVFPSAIGVLVRHAADVRIAHNHIHDTYYTAISAGWVWGYEPSVTNAIRIEKNHIHDIGQGVLSDMGGVYMLGIQPGSVIRGNRVHGVRAAGYGGWAIYPDEGSSHLVIEDNVAYDTTGHVFHQHYGNENTVRNNVFAFGGEGVLALSRGPAHNGGRGALAFTLERNVLVSDGKPVIATGLSGEGAEAATRPFLSDLNLFWDASGASVALGDGQGAGTGGLRKAYDVAGWQALGLDRHSVVADPRFQDPAARDLRLAPGSPALALGFRPIDLSDVGPRPRGKRD